MIKVGICVAYDWIYLKQSLPILYPYADKICMGLDKDRHSWKCNPYEFDEDAFYAFVKEIDVDGKIDVYEDDFSLPELNSRENCNRHRHMIADRLGPDGWHIQVDSDEYFLDFGGFVKYLKAFNPKPTFQDKPINISCPFIPLIKKTSTGYLYVDFKNHLPEIIPMATNKPDYQRARQNGHFNHIAPFYVIHETWARSENELWYKMNNWGHAAEELHAAATRQSYFNLWKALDEYNYQYVANYHPAKGPVWPALGFWKADNIEALLETMPAPVFPLSQTQLALLNNRNIARLKAVLKK